MMATTQVRGPQTPAHMYSEYTELYWANISQLGRHEGSRFRMMVHDTRLLLQRLAMGASFATDSGGGSAHSNVKLLPFLMQMGYQCLGDSGTSIWRQAAASLSKHITRGVSAPQGSPAAARAVASPARESRDSSAASSVDGADYYAVMTLWFPEKWRVSKNAILLAMVGQALRGAGLNTDAPRWWEDGGTAALDVCRPPITLMALISRLHTIFNTSNPPAPSSDFSEANSWTNEADIAQKRIRNEHMALMDQCDELVDFNQELGVSESITEILDVGELLQDLCPAGDVDAFMTAAVTAANLGGTNETGSSTPAAVFSTPTNSGSA